MHSKGSNQSEVYLKMLLAFQAFVLISISIYLLNNKFIKIIYRVQFIDNSHDRFIKFIDGFQIS